MNEVTPGWSALLALQRATHATLQVLAAEIADLGLTGSEINVLANLADGRSRSVSELGRAAGTRPTTLTSVLDRLERRGHITRRPRLGVGFAGRRERSLYLRQTSFGDIVAMLRHRPLRQILEIIGVLFSNESSAHRP